MILIGIVKSIKGKMIKALTQGSNEPVKKITIKQIDTGKENVKTLISKI